MTHQRINLHPCLHCSVSGTGGSAKRKIPSCSMLY